MDRTMLRYRNNHGFTMIEVMIAILVFGFGLLGLALLQSLSVKSTQSSSFRSQATVMAYWILDSMRANRAEVLVGDYFADNSAVACSATDPTAASTSARDLAVWKNRIACLLPGGQGAVHFPGNNQVQILIQWKDARWAVNTADQSTAFTLNSTL